MPNDAVHLKVTHKTTGATARQYEVMLTRNNVQGGSDVIQTMVNVPIAVLRTLPSESQRDEYALERATELAKLLLGARKEKEARGTKLTVTKNTGINQFEVVFACKRGSNSTSPKVTLPILGDWALPPALTVEERAAAAVDEAKNIVRKFIESEPKLS